jgi:hypothetical protein
MNICKYCNIEKLNAKSRASHERLCNNNPHKALTFFQNNEWQHEKGTNKYLKANKNNTCKPIVSDETRIKLSNAAKGRTLTDEHKKILSDFAIKNNLGGVRQSRKIKYKNKLLGSTYEYKLAVDLDKNNIKWDTCKRFRYIDPNGKDRTYTPDIYLIEYDIYLDPKNDYLINNINPRLKFKDSEKIKLVESQNNIKIFILNKDQLCWDYIQNNLLYKH